MRISQLIAPVAAYCLFAVGAPSQSAPVTPPLEPFHPAIAEWAQAGVTGGIPTSLPVIATLRPGDDVQAAIDAAPVTGGIIALSAGNYPLTQTLRLRSNVVLRGAGMRSTRLLVLLRGLRPAEAVRENATAWITGVSLHGIEHAGIAQLAIVYDPSLPLPPDPRIGETAYTDNPGNRTDLHVIAVGFSEARDCWISHCVILNSGSHPLLIADSRQVTADDVEIIGVHGCPVKGLI